MSDHTLSPRNYTIENDRWVGQLVSVGGKDSIVGTFGGTQKWKLAYKDGFAIFKGVSPYPAEERYIAVDWNAMALVYNKKPSNFLLERVDPERQDIFVYVPPVAIENGSQSSFGWQLQTGRNDSHVRIANVEMEGAEWKFSS